MHDACEMMRTVKNPAIALSVSLSDCYSSCNTDPSVVEMLARILYHVTLRCFRFDSNGKYCVDQIEHAEFLQALYAFLGTFERLFYR